MPKPSRWTNPIFTAGTPVREGWVNLYAGLDTCGLTVCEPGQVFFTRLSAVQKARRFCRPFARVRVIPKTNPRAEEVFS